MSRLVWYRNDLRVHFHRPLQAARASGEPVRAVYLLCPGQWQQHGVAPVRQWYALASLLELGDALADIGIALDVLHCEDFAAAAGVLADYVRTHAVRHIHCTREYPLNEMRRDRAVARRMAELEVEILGEDDSVLVPPRQLKTGQGGWYTVFTPYRKRWEAWLAEYPVPRPGRLWRDPPVDFPGRAVVQEALDNLSVSEELRSHWQPGEAAARQQLKAFVGEQLSRYHAQRDLPAVAGTSLLSAALSAGTLSAAECFSLAQARRESHDCKGADTWIGELAWRDFYRQIMANFPRLAWGEPFRQDTRWVQWRRDQRQFEAWCEGRTGIPLVDAAMRQLKQTGWMHNRLRMVTAMFLTKHLFIDWRWGERWFMANLIDGDFAANNGGWQWSASTGTDAAPYFRVFNPVRQAQRFDPDGEFIRRYVPELRGLEGKAVHEPWRQPLLAPDYPSPITELAGVRERVTEAFQTARDLAQQEQD